jgi:hypothetical protein
MSRLDGIGNRRKREIHDQFFRLVVTLFRLLFDNNNSNCIVVLNFFNDSSIGVEQEIPHMSSVEGSLQHPVVAASPLVIKTIQLNHSTKEQSELIKEHSNMRLLSE